MKKTLIALAVAASAAVSGSAMAAGWEANSHGGSAVLSGTLTPADVVTPWEVKVGNASGLDAFIQKGQKTVEIKATSAIPVLGIRNADASGFRGGIQNTSPQIDYGNAVNLDAFNNDATTSLTLNVTNAQGEKIGTLSVPFFTAAVLSWGNGGRQMASSESGSAFFGGLPKSVDGISSGGPQTALARLTALSSELTEKYKNEGGWEGYVQNEKFTDSNQTFWASYGGGIESGKSITITLDNAASGDAPIEWKASLPVTVTYA